MVPVPIFFFNNPEEVLIPFDRCKAVLEEPGISKINLTTGPQALSGSTRMQASTIDAFLIAQILQTGLERALRRFLSDKEMARLGFTKPVVFAEELGEFSDILKDVKKIIPFIAEFTKLAEKTYREEHVTIYSALKGFGAIFNDCAEWGTTFFHQPLDTVKTEPRKSQIQAWAPQPNLEQAWLTLLGRPFRGLSPSSYKSRLEQEIKNPDLLQTTWKRLKNAEDDQQFLYDFSLSDFNLRNRGAETEDLGVLVIISPEEILLKERESYVLKFVSHILEKGANMAILFITEKSENDIHRLVRKIPGFDPGSKDAIGILPMDSKNDPLAINPMIALKIILNAHSSAVMARSGRVVGNTVISINPRNLKSIGRATSLLLSHVNDVLKRPNWVKQHGIKMPISYGEANAILFDAIRFMNGRREGFSPSFEVALSIIRILESLRSNKAHSFEEALTIFQNRGLRQYLKDVTS